MDFRAPTPSLEVRGLSKRYGGVLAVQDVSFALASGQILALAGHNGAGKSTLIGMLAGARHPDGGQIFVAGEERRFAKPSDAQNAGIGVCYQEPMLIPQLSVAANVFLTREPTDQFRRLSRRQLRRNFEELVDRTGIKLPSDEPVGRLSVAQRQLAQILRVLAAGARTVILDEPTAALSPEDRGRLFVLMHRLRDAGTVSNLIFVSHFLHELEENCDRAIVLRNGAVVADMHHRPDAKVLAQLMVGDDKTTSQTVSPAGSRPPGGQEQQRSMRDAAVLLTVEGLSVAGKAPVNLQVKDGEIVGLAGLVGSGRTELLEAIALGHDRAGEVRIGGTVVRRASDALAHGIALTPESRRNALIFDWPLWKNVTLPSLRRNKMPLRWRRADEVRRAEELLVRCKVPADRVNHNAGTLSGGNQQKVVFAKLLASDFKVGLLDEPTHGIDVGAKAEIFQIIRDMAGEGRGFLVVSAEFEDLLAVSTRIITMHKGAFVAEHPNDPGLSPDLLLLEAATGTPAATPPEGPR